MPSWLCMSVLLATLPMDNPNPWEETAKTDNFTLWQREVAGSDIEEVRVEALINASSLSLWRILRDVPRFTEFMPYMKQARVLLENGDHRLVYQRISPPVVNDRDFTMSVRAYEDYQTGVFQQDFTVANDRGPPPVDGVVRVQVVTGRWVLEPIGKGKTRMTYWVHTDPGGYIPTWVINFGQRYSLPKHIEALEKRARDPSWKP